MVRAGKGPDASRILDASRSHATTRTDLDLAAVVAERIAYSVEEVAAVLGIGRTLAWALVRSGQLPSIRVAGRVLIRRRQLLEWLDATPETNYPSA